MPFHFQRIRHWGACGKTHVLPHNRRPMSDPVEEVRGKWQLMDVAVDVVVVGAGPTGLMLAGELGQAGIRTLLLERRPEPSEMAKAGGLAGQILQLLHYRGELDRFREASIGATGRRRGPRDSEPAPRFPFGGLHLDFAQLEDSPMRAMLLPQPRLEGVLVGLPSSSHCDLVSRDVPDHVVTVRGLRGLWLEHLNGPSASIVKRSASP